MIRLHDCKEKDNHSLIHIDRPSLSPDGIHSSGIRSSVGRAFTPDGRDGVALVVFSLGNPECGYTFSAHIVWILLGRKDQFREIGWLDDRHIGVLIPGATPTDALRFAESFRRQIPERVPLRYRVYCSPPSRYRYTGGRRNSSGIPSERDVRFTPFARVYSVETT